MVNRAEVPRTQGHRWGMLFRIAHLTDLAKNLKSLENTFYSFNIFGKPLIANPLKLNIYANYWGSHP